jgi:multidrug resistance protein, MATE family
MSGLENSKLSWEQAPLGALVRLSWPIVVSMLSVSTMTLVDTLFVSRLGSAAVAGVGLAGVLTFCLWCFPIGVIRAVKILVSQSVGAGERDAFRPYLVAALVLAAAFGVVVTFVGQLLVPLLPSLTATPESGRFAGEYLALRVLGSVPILMLIAVQEARQGFGDSRTLMFTTLFGNSLNVALDYLFIFVFDWGVRGAGAASSVALSFEFVAVVAVHAWRDGFRTNATRKSHFRDLWRLGLPSGIQFGLEVGAFGLMVIILSAFSELHTAAHQIAVQVLHFAFLPAFAFGEAGSVLAGQAIGATRPALVATVAKLTLGLALGYATVCGFVLFFGSSFIVRAFTDEADLLQLTARLFTIMAVFQFVDAANLVGRAVLRGTGDVRYVAWVGILSAWVCTPPMTYLLGYVMGWGAYGAWIGLSGEVLLVTLLYWRRLGRTYFTGRPVAVAASQMSAS